MPFPLCFQIKEIPLLNNQVSYDQFEVKYEETPHYTCAIFSDAVNRSIHNENIIIFSLCTRSTQSKPEAIEYYLQPIHADKKEWLSISILLDIILLQKKKFDINTVTAALIPYLGKQFSLSKWQETAKKEATTLHNLPLDKQKAISTILSSYLSQKIQSECKKYIPAESATNAAPKLNLTALLNTDEDIKKIFALTQECTQCLEKEKEKEKKYNNLAFSLSSEPTGPINISEETDSDYKSEYRTEEVEEIMQHDNFYTQLASIPTTAPLPALTAFPHPIESIESIESKVSSETLITSRPCDSIISIPSLLISKTNPNTYIELCCQCSNYSLIKTTISISDLLISLNNLKACSLSNTSIAHIPYLVTTLDQENGTWQLTKPRKGKANTHLAHINLAIWEAIHTKLLKEKGIIPNTQLTLQTIMALNGKLASTEELAGDKFTTNQKLVDYMNSLEVRNNINNIEKNWLILLGIETLASSLQALILTKEHNTSLQTLMNLFYKKTCIQSKGEQFVTEISKDVRKVKSPTTRKLISFLINTIKQKEHIELHHLMNFPNTTESLSDTVIKRNQHPSICPNYIAVQTNTELTYRELNASFVALKHCKSSDTHIPYAILEYNPSTKCWNPIKAQINTNTFYISLVHIDLPYWQEITKKLLSVEYKDLNHTILMTLKALANEEFSTIAFDKSSISLHDIADYLNHKSFNIKEMYHLWTIIIGILTLTEANKDFSDINIKNDLQGTSNCIPNS